MASPEMQRALLSSGEFCNLCVVLSGIVSVFARLFLKSSYPIYSQILHILVSVRLPVCSQRHSFSRRRKLHG